ncbi:MAG: hypothetical protein HY852_03555 [Bradyrhizobium sp.]|uniref:hypothetical protein n=1 Tax=Bradyrhizobium sp. TaxID=376 RepID=UPI0025C17179|nr:hypothetical protein [Bradyrhizobium sp.]MBI5260879.1 hypothetical protein [Bradyrhizobium sp.]
MNTSPHDSTGLVSVTEAARRLTEAGDKVERSTLSRYVDRYAAALNPVKRGRETVLDFETLRKHRAENINLDAKPLAGARSKSDSQARKLDADARLRELDLAERESKLTLRDEVAEGAAVAIAAMRAAMDAAVNDTAEQLAHQFAGEARLIRPKLRAMTAKGFDAFADMMRAYASDPHDALSTPASDLNAETAER